VPRERLLFSARHYNQYVEQLIVAVRDWRRHRVFNPL
jgi:hypothetical protein